MQFRRRLPPDALLLLERLGDRGGVGTDAPGQSDCAPDNMLCAEVGDGDRIRRQIAEKRRRMGIAQPQMLPSFERALSFNSSHPPAIGRMMPVGFQQAPQQQTAEEEEEPQLLLEG